MADQQQSNQSSIFRLAIGEYLASRKPKSSTPQFLLDILDGKIPASKDDVQKTIIELEKNTSSHASTRRVRTVLRPVVRVLTDYTGVLDTLAQSDPMPTCVIWGCLRAVVEASNRFVRLYDEIKDQLDALQMHLDRLTAYEELFGEHELLQKPLQQSYINVIRFWRRVEKECRRCVFNRMSRGLASFSTSKLDVIVACIQRDADEIDKLVPIIQENLQREERRLAGLAREQQGAFNELQRQELTRREQERRHNRLKDVRRWLQVESLPLIESNYRQHEWNYESSHSGTCQWLKEDRIYLQWLDTKTPMSKIWLRAPPGAGKSVLCASTIQQVKTEFSTSCLVFQYFSFRYFCFEENRVSEVDIYRCIAEQLVNCLWRRVEDVPDDLHVLTQQSLTSSKSEDMKSMIKTLLCKLTTTYLFFDGLDEVCDDGQCWGEVEKTIGFFSSIATCNSSMLRLWCSSQDRSPIRSTLCEFDTIEMTTDSNSKDIELYLRESMTNNEILDIDEGTHTLILRDLCQKAMGSFLWASLMLDSVNKALALNEIQDLINKSVPKDCEIYYKKKLDSIPIPQRRYVSSLLACMVHAKRPLELEQLCEAIAILYTPDGQDLDKSQRIFKNKILRICEPLIQVKETTTKHGTISICEFCHASVRNFLEANENIFGSPSNSQEYDVSNKTVADLCLRYLCQPRYSGFLKSKEGSFTDTRECNILEHKMLGYAAKYWDKHLDDVPSSPMLCARVREFLNSDQYYTCLQTQSLLVEGQFSPWYSATRLWEGPQFRRVFPRWLEQSCEPRLADNYRFFVYEWGNFLAACTQLDGPCPGEIDRCFWNALGSHNFLRSGKSRYKNFAFGNEDLENTSSRTKRFFEGIDETGDFLNVVTLQTANDQHSQLHFNCQRWSLKGRTPKLLSSQLLDVKDPLWHLYDQPISESLPRPNQRPPPVSFTPDLQILRIGSCLFSLSVDKNYNPVFSAATREEYFEEVTSRAPFIALSSRQQLTEENIVAERTESLETAKYEVYDFSEDLQEILEESLKSESSADTTTGKGNSDKTQTSVSSRSSSNTSLSLLDEVEMDVTGTQKFEDRKEDSSDMDSLENVAAETDSNSAVSSYSEASTAEFSHEMEDEDQWNDWEDGDFPLDREVEGSASDGDQASAEQLDSDADIRSRAESEGSEDISESRFHVSGPLGLRLFRDSSSTADSSPNGSIESDYSASYAASSEATDSEEEEDSEDQGRGLLEDVLMGRRKSGDPKRMSRVKLRVYNQYQRGFHFSRSITGGIFASPPTIHPSESLLVWPLGDQEILFADIDTNTYFTRQLSCTYSQACHVSITSRFSKDGKYLHFAALEAQKVEENPKAKVKSNQVLMLHLQVSTHRLSSRKTTRSPPRLVYRTTIPVGSKSKLHVANLPYTLTWTASHLYFTSGEESLSVIKIPLFRLSGINGLTNSSCQNREPIYLPRMDLSRRVYFFPPPAEHQTANSDKKSKKHTPKATMIIGSHCSVPSQRHFVPESLMSPPIGVYLDEDADLGGWKCRTIVDELNGGRQGGKLNPSAGRLQSMFEAFDMNDDCDIVPFIA